MDPIFVKYLSSQFGICTVVGLNGTLVEEKCVDSRANVHIFAATSVPYIHYRRRSAKLGTNSHETDNSASSPH
jgi:hypothetical protein